MSIFTSGAGVFLVAGLDERFGWSPGLALAIHQRLCWRAGCEEGIVRRIDCVEDGNQIQPGEILVTTITNVGWTPLFPRLVAIVTDVGAPLSHAAIVARELGIPAMAGCGNATMLLNRRPRPRRWGTGNG